MTKMTAKLIVALTVAATAACTGDIGGVEDGPEISSTSSQIQMGRMAINEGLTAGNSAIVTSVNLELGERLIAFDFSSGAELPAPAPAVECPFVPQMEIIALQSCRDLAERARDHAYVRLAAALDEGPQADELQVENDNELSEFVAYWHHEGGFSGVNSEVVRAENILRQAGLCDQEMTGIQSSRGEGYEIGREIFLEQLDVIARAVPPTECDFDRAIIGPAVEATEELVPEVLNARPLCPEYVPQSADDASEFDQANLGYELGIREGIRDQSVISSQVLFQERTCITEPEADPEAGLGDPLVVDLMNDGIAPATARVTFDIGGTGVAAQVAWPAAGDALLALDVNGNGEIDNGRELFSNYMVGPGNARFEDGCDALAIYDRAAMGGNGDGVIDASDAIYSSLLVWSDANRDGKSTATELTSLADANVPSISLETEELKSWTGDALLTKRAGNVGELWLHLDY